MGQEQNHSWIRCGCTSHLLSVLKDFKFLMCHRLIKAPPFFLLWPLFSPSKPHTLIIYIWRYIRQIQPAFARLIYVPREKKKWRAHRWSKAFSFAWRKKPVLLLALFKSLSAQMWSYGFAYHGFFLNHTRISYLHVHLVEETYHW